MGEQQRDLLSTARERALKRERARAVLLSAEPAETESEKFEKLREARARRFGLAIGVSAERVNLPFTAFATASSQRTLAPRRSVPEAPRPKRARHANGEVYEQDWRAGEQDWRVDNRSRSSGDARAQDEQGKSSSSTSRGATAPWASSYASGSGGGSSKASRWAWFEGTRWRERGAEYSVESGAHEREPCDFVVTKRQNGRESKRVPIFEKGDQLWYGKKGVWFADYTASVQYTLVWTPWESGTGKREFSWTRDK